MIKTTNLLFSVCMFFLSISVGAQVPRKVLVEHFTNTNCSVCASRNPGFYTNVNAQNGLLYLSVHPSAPYSSCLLSIQNKTDNDARTNHYGIYGSTPRLVINGNIISASTNYASQALFSSHLNQVSSFDIKIAQEKVNDSIHSRVVITTVSAHSYTSLKLFSGLAEDTVFYQGGNGETKHYNVLRKSLYGSQGLQITPATNPGDSVVYEITSATGSVWNSARMFTVAWIQTSTGTEILQSAMANPDGEMPVATGVNDKISTTIPVFPNPAADKIRIGPVQGGVYNLKMYSSDGKPVYETPFTGNTEIDMSSFPRGMYFLKVTGEQTIYTQKVLLQ